ncbi:MAG: hypothetical protein RJA44_712 [Pseudomonadota bacterium]
MAAPLMSLNLNSTTSTTAGSARTEAAQGDGGSDGSLFARLMQASAPHPADAAKPELDGTAAAATVADADASADAGADPQAATPADMAQWLAQLGLVLPNGVPTGLPPVAGGRVLPGQAGPDDAVAAVAAANGVEASQQTNPFDPAALAAGLLPGAVQPGRTELPTTARAGLTGVARELAGGAAAQRPLAADLPATVAAAQQGGRFRLDAAGAAGGRRDAAAGGSNGLAGGAANVAPALASAAATAATPVATAAAVTPTAAVSAGPEALGSRAGRDLRELRESGNEPAGLTGTGGLNNGHGALPTAALQAAQPLSTPTVTAAPVVNLPIALPVSDPAFGAVVMTRVAGLAEQGVQQAQLHLNPAEMGPIVVHIAVEQGQAQVDFHAAHAATRELLESSLPLLAQSFQDDGLRLVASRVEDLSAADTRQDGGLAQSWGGDQGQQSAGSGQSREQAAASGQFRAGVPAGRGGQAGGSVDPVAAAGQRARSAAAGRLDLYA